jgi:aminoglycoside phosphotransferase (APT) family kinase protein
MTGTDTGKGRPTGAGGEVLDAQLMSFVQTLVADQIGTRGGPQDVRVLAAASGRATILLSAGRPPTRLVLKLAAPDDPQVDFERTATATAMARRAGVPVAAVLAADRSGRPGPWQYLLQEHVDGEEWRAVRPRLDPDQAAAAHRRIAAMVLALQSVSLPGFGELSSTGSSGAAGVLPALRVRASLRIADPARRALFLDVLDREAALFSGADAPVLAHDDLHHGNVVFRAGRGDWVLAGVLDWDKAWAGPRESDVARMGFWDDMTGPAFWQTYRAAYPLTPGAHERMLIHQLLWCLEYDVSTSRHRADTAAVCGRLGVAPPPSRS